MYYAVQFHFYHNNQWIRSKSKPDMYLGICSCGKYFHIQENLASQWCTEWKILDKIRCPYCGAPYGNVFFTDLLDERENFLDNEVRTKLTKVKIEPTQEGFIIYKEPIVLSTYRESLSQVHSYQLEFSLIPKPVFTHLLLDGVGIPMTKTNLTKATNRVIMGRLSKESPSFYELLTYTSNCVGTSSLPALLQALVDYPVICTVYNDGQPKYDAHVIKQGLQNGAIRRGERSEKKAYGLNKSLLSCLCEDMAPIHEMQRLQNEVGPEKAKTGIEKSFLITNTRYDYELAHLFSELTSKECNRLEQYLTHDVDIYQGIGKAKEAWEILKDYRRMCIDMEVTPELCPKSLKLQHDIAARNYKLILDEIQRRKFVDRVAQPDYKRLNWSSQTGEWAVLVPNGPEDLIVEGRKQSHCVGSYVSYVCDGTYRICFLRRQEDLEQPVLTLTVDKDDCCIYYKGFDNREATKEEINVLESWAKAKNLTLGDG